MELRKLASIANKLDSLGLTKEADVIDRYISKVAAVRPNVSKNAQFVVQVNSEFRMLPEAKKQDIIQKVGIIERNHRPVGQYMGDDVLRTYIAKYLINTNIPFGDILYDDPKEQASLEADIEKYRKSGRVGTGGGSGGSGGGKTKPGGGGSSGGGDSWAKYIATAKDPKTGKVNTELNTRVKQVWQSTNPAQKEFSGFTSWYSKQKGNMSGLGLTAKDFGQEQAIALIQTTGGSGKGWEGSDAALASIYKNIVINQSPASFDPSSVGLGRSGAGYAADLKGYKPTEGRTSDPAKALLRSQMAGPAEEEYAGTATSFKDNSEFMYDPDVEKQMAARRSQKPQGMQGADSAAELARRTRNLAGERKTELED